MNVSSATIKRNLKTNRPGAIVLGGNFVGLGVARSLGVHGIPVWIIDHDKSRAMARWSRYTKRFIWSKDKIEDLLLSEGRQNGLDGWVIFPVTDEYVEAVSKNHQSLSTIYRLTTPPQDITQFALDKRLTYRKAAELDIAVPRRFSLTTANDANDFSYPVILKPAVNHHFFPSANVKALRANGVMEFHRQYAQMRAVIPAEEILVQELIPGGGENQFSFGAMCIDGCVCATIVAQRRRQYPIEFGNASTFVETTDHPVVEEFGRRFLQGIGFDGIAEVEFKVDPRDGSCKILDVNTRPWGWHTLGKAAGVDFPYLLWRQKIGDDIPKMVRPRRAAWFREMTDFVAIAKSKHPVAEMRRLLQAVLRGDLTAAAFDILDPIPFFAEFALWIRTGLARQRRASNFLGNLDATAMSPEDAAANPE